MKYFDLVFCCFLLVLSCKKGDDKKVEIPKKEVVQATENYLVGTYTDSLSQGINLISFLPENHGLQLNSVIDSLQNPSFVVANNSKNIIATVGEIQGEKGGLLRTFSYSKENNVFTLVSTVNTLGNNPCTLAFSPNENAIIVGNYSGGNLSVFPINDKGELLDTPQVIQHIGNSVTKERQENAHVHCVVFHPLEQKVFVVDLGNDTIESIPFTDDKGTFQLLTEKTIVTKVSAGLGPRHMIFNEKGDKAYIVFELTNEVGVFEYKNNELILNEVVALTETKTRLGSAAEIKLSKDNQFLYVSVRGEDNQLVVFHVKNKLEKIQTIPTGLQPRNFILTNEENFVLVANQGSNTIFVYERDKKTGWLTKTSSEITINKPVYFCRF